MTRTEILVMAMQHSYLADTRVPDVEGGPVIFHETLCPHYEAQYRHKGATMMAGVARVTPEQFEKFYANHPHFVVIASTELADMRAALDELEGAEQPADTVPIDDPTPPPPGTEGGKDGTEPNPLAGLDFTDKAWGVAVAGGLTAAHFADVLPSGKKNEYTMNDVRAVMKAMASTE